VVKTNPQKIPLSEKLAYGATELGANFVWRGMMVFLPIFYTDVFGLTPGDVALLLLVSRLGDGVSDLAMGMLADRVTTRWGKFRPWLLWCGPLVALMTVATFYTPDTGYAGKLIYAYISYNLCIIAYTALTVPFAAMTGVMSGDPDERTKLTSLRFVFAFGGALLLQGFTTQLVSALGQGDDALGYRYTMMLYSAVGLGCFLITFWKTRERIAPVAGPSPKIKESLGDLLQNRAWFILCATGALFVVTASMKQGSIMYYFTHVIGDTELAAGFMVLGLIGSMVGAGLTGLMTRKWGRKNLMILSLSVMGASSLALYWCDPSNRVPIFAWFILSEFAAGPVITLFVAMLADVADFSEWKHGRRATALTFSAGTFSLKSGTGLGGFVLGVVLAQTGYVANAEQTAEAVHGITLLMSVFPAIIAAGATIIFLLYPLTEKNLAQIKNELDNRRALKPE
jgi:glycoside/pentoside/hexuronide:cation symporter, GPH family